MIGGKIWNILYEAKKKKINPKNLKFHSRGNVSPYMELNFENMNYLELQKDGINEIHINPYYRYFDIFNTLLDVKQEEFIELRDIVFNNFCHFLGALELKKGLTREDYYLKLLEKELKDNCFGEQLKKEFYETFHEDEIKKVIVLILYNYRDGSSLEHFCKGVQKIFKNSIIYNFKEEDEDLIIFISNKKSEKNSKKIELLENLFLPIGIKTRVFWEHHFGIVGNEDTGSIDNIGIF